MTTHWLEGTTAALIQKEYVLVTSPTIIRLTCRLFNITWPAGPPQQLVTITTAPGFRQGTVIGYLGSLPWLLQTQVELLVIDVPNSGGHTYNAGDTIYINWECNDSDPVNQRVIMQTVLIEEIP